MYYVSAYSSVYIMCVMYIHIYIHIYVHIYQYPGISDLYIITLTINQLE